MTWEVFYGLLFFYYICTMEKYALFINSNTDYLLLPIKQFIGAKYSSATVLDLYFEKAPLSYKIPLTITSKKGEEVIRAIIETFHGSIEKIITFSDTDSLYPSEDITAVGTFTKIVVK